jgi:signal peptidase II
MKADLGGRARYGALAALIVVADQITKALVDRALELHESRPLVEGLLSLTYVRNRGAAFGFLNEADLPYQSALFAVVSLGALVAIAAYSLHLPARHRLAQAALSLVLGGAIGNLIDRARLGYVIDFVDVYWRSHHWPAFNVADSAISTGIVLLLADMLRTPATEGSPAAPTPAGRGEYGE